MCFCARIAFLKMFQSLSGHWLVKCMFIVLSLTFCCAGDWLQRALSSIAVPPTDVRCLAWTRAVLDSSTHGVVALVSWCAVSWPAIGWRALLTSLVVGAGIDLDHVIAAGSFDINAITHLSHRPLLHATTPWLLLAPLVALGSTNKVRLSAAILLNAALTHHVRDASRRGLWLPPFGSTTALSWPVYLLLEAATPLLIAALLSWNATTAHSYTRVENV